MSPSHALQPALQPSLQRTQDADGRALHRAASENHCRRTKRQPPKNYILNLTEKSIKQQVHVAFIALERLLIAGVYSRAIDTYHIPYSFRPLVVNAAVVVRVTCRFASINKP